MTCMDLNPSSHSCEPSTLALSYPAISYPCLDYTLQRLNKLADTRTAKLRETLGAILEFESGMQALITWLGNTEKKLMEVNLPDWRSETIANGHRLVIYLLFSSMVSTVLFLSAIVCPWLDFGLPPRFPQVVWCH